MTAKPVLSAPNPEVFTKLRLITDKSMLQFITDKSMDSIDQLNFKVPPKAESHKTEHPWNIAYVAEALVLGALAAFAYTQSRPYIAIGLGVTAALTLYLGRMQVDIPGPLEIGQRKRINTLFQGVALELRRNWEVASNIFAKRNSNIMKSADEAGLETSHLVIQYRLAGIDDPFKTLSAEENQWRDSFQNLFPIAYSFVTNKKMDDLTNDPGLHPFVKEQLLQVYVECTRFVYGSVPAVPDKPYVENKMVGKRFVSQPWPAPALKV